MKYIFTAKDDSGGLKKGTVDAIDRELAVQILQRNGLTPVSVDRESSGFSFEREIQKMLDRVTQKELMIFFRQLATLIEARVPIVSSLHAIGEQSDNKYLKLVVKSISDDLEDGMPFSEALARFPDVFQSLTVSMVRAGEMSGNLQKSVVFIADNIERNYTLSSRVRSALFYPGFVVAVAGIIGFIVISFILPRLTIMIKDLGVAVPWYTRFIMGLGDFMQVYWWAVLLIIISCIATGYFYARSEDGRREWNHIQLKIPVLGSLFRYIYITRFADNFSALLSSGIPVVRALYIVSDVVGNTVYQSVILRAADEVKTGKTISSVFARSTDIPPVVSRMIAIGEETGKMDHVLASVSRFYSQEVDNMTRNMTSLIEPVLIVVLGIGVCILVVSVIMPIYNITGSM